MRGRFITFEGIDGAGKSGHIEPTATFLRAQGIDVVVTREPGGTPLGEKLRSLLLTENMHLETEALLMFAARREHLARVIEPALARGAWVLSDRFSDASYAYQCGGRGLSQTKFEVLQLMVHPKCNPDLTLLFDLPVDIARDRIAGTRQLDRFEVETQDFHQHVRAAYLRRASIEPTRIKIVDASPSEVDVAAQVDQLVRGLVANESGTGA